MKPCGGASSGDRTTELDSTGPLIVIAAHPDDEVIGVGGQLVSWTARRAVTIVSVTDGAPIDNRDAGRAGFATRADYAAARRRELHEAVALLPNPPAVLHMHFTDQRLMHEIGSVAHVLARLLERLAPAIVVTHAYEGGHPDHDTLALAVQVVAARAHRSFLRLEFAGYSEDADGGLRTNRFADDRSCVCLRVALCDEERRLKRAMLQCFRSQQETLRVFHCEEECLRPAPQHDFDAAPNGGRIWYDRFDWGLSSREWLGRARAWRRGHHGIPLA